MDSKRKKELEDVIDNALNHEDKTIHDDNDDPVTFAGKKDNKKQK